MMLDRSVEAAWAARLAEAGVAPERFDGVDGDGDYVALQRAILTAAHDELLSHEDLHPLFVRFWTGHWPLCTGRQTHRRLSDGARRSSRPGRNANSTSGSADPTGEAVQGARDAIVAELGLTPTDLFGVLADHWLDLRDHLRPEQAAVRC